jgi:sugar/nucleoside kinase (ribokinase family)
VSRYDYVAVGHVTCDVLGEGIARHEQPGGTAFYSALQAARLGLSALVVTQGVPGQIERLLSPYRDEIGLHVIPTAQTTTLATRVEGANRVQSVLAWAGAIADTPVLDAEIVHLAPVARETPSRWRGHAAFVGITPQGLVRNWPGGEVAAVALDAALLPGRFDAAVISEHERPCCAPLFAAAEQRGACIVVTAGPRPATVYVGSGNPLRCAVPHAVEVRDDLGAGDVFAAAFFVASTEGREPRAAAAFAHAAAAVRVAGLGADAIGSRAQIQRQLV